MQELNWLKIEAVLHWTSVAVYIVSTVLYAHSAMFKKERSAVRALYCAVVGLVPHSAALIGRWIVQGHGPYMSRYEVISSDVWVTLVLFIALAFRWERIKPAGMIILPVSLLLMAFGLLTDPGMHDLPPSLRSIWLVMHITFAKLAAGAITCSFGLAMVYLLRARGVSFSFFARFPSQEVIDEYSYKFAGFGLIFWTINIAAGSIWAEYSWGRFWGWDPIETWSLITWLMYGLFAHLRLFWKWNGVRSAWMLTAAFILSLFTIFILPFIAQSLHTEYFIQ